MTTLLPTTLPLALEELEKSKEWAEKALIPGYLKWFLALKRHEMEKQTGMTAVERRKLLVSYF